MESFDPYEFMRRHIGNTKLIEKITYTPFELHLLCGVSCKLFEREPMLMRTTAPCAVIGDLYGHAGCARLLFENIVKKESSHTYVLLGNYIGESALSLETLCFLLIYKLFGGPGLFTLLRGRNECVEESRRLGFEDELVKRFGEDEGKELFDHFNEVFSWMPVAAIVDDTTFCAHGGILPHLRSLEDIEKIPRPLVDFSTSPLAYDLINAQPKEDCRTFIPNPERPFSVLFGRDNLAKFLLDFNLKQVFRGYDGLDVGIFLPDPSFEDNLVSLSGAANIMSYFCYFGASCVVFPGGDYNGFSYGN